MSDVLKLKYKVGEIEFEAEGSAEDVEQQRKNFMNSVLPAAVDAMVKTREIVEDKTYIEAKTNTKLIAASSVDDNMVIPIADSNDYTRISLSSFIKKYGELTEQDFALISAYFYEIKNGIKIFSIEDVKKYYSEARRPLPKNPSMLLYALVQKGYIIDAQPTGDKSGKPYMISEDGMTYIKDYVPKEINNEKKKTITKQRKTTNKTSAYIHITSDDLNLKNYPSVRLLTSPKEQVIMAMYIVANENKGEWFTVEDVIHLLVNVFEVQANVNMVNGVFKRNKSMFYAETDPNNKKALQRKLLSGAKDLAKEIIENNM